MRALGTFRAGLFAGAAFLQVAPAMAQTSLPPADPAVAPAPVPTDVGTKRVYTLADFARFAPKTAYDLLVQVPGFSIRSADQERGLGQASENVLINGQRIANKSGGAIDQLQKIGAANVDRIEVVDAASLGIAGLSGQVANVIVKTAAKSSGQFEWNPDFRAHYSKPNLFNGTVSYSGKTGPLDYTLSAKNQAGRGAYGGPIRLYDADGVNFENRHEVYHSESDLPTFSTKFGLDGPGSSVGNLLLSYTPYWAPSFSRERRERLDGANSRRVTATTLDGWYYDINADYEFRLGPGRLKLIGVRHFDHEPIITRQVDSFESGAADEGIEFRRDSRIGETIGRAEYGWKSGKNDWQLSFERAFNSLDPRGSLAELSPDGEFESVPYPGGSGKVQETRYEGILTFSRALSPKLDLQVAAGAETSTLSRVDSDLPARKFFRPKGSVTLGWRPSKGWDASLKLRRRVGQISFYDFLSQPSLSQDRENAGNPNLVPPQSWEAEVEVGRELGVWGKTRLRAYAHRIDDIVDFIPLENHTEGVGNLPRATRFGMESTSTLLFDPIGWQGAKLDLTLGFEHTSVKDPLTGKKRAISGTQDRWASAALRHDVPNSKLAWGVEASYGHYSKYYYLTEVQTSWEGPWFVDAYVEHKDVFGLTVRATLGNIFNARHIFNRTIYEDWRVGSPIDVIEKHNQLIGPVFSFSVRGNF
jgi:hypothetical protein